ncbi:hypothetical protein [Paraburkholderia sp. GAS42]|uniref:hypothetical protein n=1 Tax=Paraburkholderia sp. GAS42 TaxID=3035135 RepID=UPI003D211F7C
MSISKLARETIASITVHGASKHELGELDQIVIRSIGTERAYRTALTGYLQWLIDYRVPLEDGCLGPMMLEFLDQYAEGHAQKSVNQAKKMLEKVYSVRLPHIDSSVEPVVHGKAYGFDAVTQTLRRQTERNQLSTLLCYDAGLRAHECITLSERSMNEPSPHRTWSKECFLGRTDYVIFVVTGKGGLRREVAISLELVEELMKRKRRQPVIVRDREIDHISYFDIGGGQALSASFSRASELALGWSRGLHGLRHSFAQNRLRTLIELLGPQRALQILSEELGHFRSEISLAYLVGR